MSQDDNTTKLPSAKEMEFLSLLAKHTRNKPDVDWDAFVKEAKFKNKVVASTRYGQIRRKLGWNNGGGTTKATDNGSKESPKKVTKRDSKPRAAKGRKIKFAESDEEEQELDTLSGTTTEIDEAGKNEAGHIKKEVESFYDMDMEDDEV